MRGQLFSVALVACVTVSLVFAAQAAQAPAGTNRDQASESRPIKTSDAARSRGRNKAATRGHRGHERWAIEPGSERRRFKCAVSRPIDRPELDAVGPAERRSHPTARSDRRPGDPSADTGARAHAPADAGTGADTAADA